MKRHLLMAILLMGSGLVTYAQSNNDDGYPTGSGQQQQSQGSNDGRYYNNNSNNSNGNSGNTYNNGFNQDNNQGYNNQNNQGNNQNNNQSYNDQNSGDQYIDYENDNYYATHINRFDNPYYNQGYYSTFYNPFWYDPFWVDPLWGYNPWYRPAFGIGIGFGPYWTGGWGYNSWCGYGAFGSCWNYPIYGCGFYGGYYGGFWNGYYAGIYNGYGRYTGARNIGYGPRITSLNTVGYRGGIVRTQGFSQAYNNRGVGSATIGAGQRIGEISRVQSARTAVGNISSFRGGSVQSQTNVRSQTAAGVNQQGVQAGRGAQQSSGQRRGGFFQNAFGGNRQMAQSQGGQQAQRSFNGGGRPSSGFNGGAVRQSGFNGGGAARSFGGGGAARSGGFGGGGRSGGFSGGGHSGGGGRR
ncbi:MAG: hypothetical protein P4L41_05385 [Flavipsychrobacter sp.]|nr:hypothetical protein [Flavipsychrobacter sp.]